MKKKKLKKELQSKKRSDGSKKKAMFEKGP
jgi:hypothetical protein